MEKLVILKERAVNKGYEIGHKIMSRKRDGFNELVVVCGLAIVGVLVLIASKTPINTMMTSFINLIGTKVTTTLEA